MLAGIIHELAAEATGIGSRDIPCPRLTPPSFPVAPRHFQEAIHIAQSLAEVERAGSAKRSGCTMLVAIAAYT